jgi:hypothetical protein
MARETLSVQKVAQAGVQPSYVSAVADGHKFSNDGNVNLHIKNGSGVSVTVTVVTPIQVGNLAVSDLEIAIPAGEERMIRAHPAKHFNQPTGDDKGYVYVNYSATSSVTVGAFRFG